MANMKIILICGFLTNHLTIFLINHLTFFLNVPLILGNVSLITFIRGLFMIWRRRMRSYVMMTQDVSEKRSYLIFLFLFLFISFISLNNFDLNSMGCSLIV